MAYCVSQNAVSFGIKYSTQPQCTIIHCLCNHSRQLNRKQDKHECLVTNDSGHLEIRVFAESGFGKMETGMSELGRRA